MIYREHLDNVLKSSSGLRWRFGRHRRAWDEVAAGRSKPFFPFLLLHTWGHFTGRTLKMPGQNGIFCAFEHFTALRTLNKRRGALQIWEVSRALLLTWHQFRTLLQSVQSTDSPRLTVYEQSTRFATSAAHHGQLRAVVNESWTGKKSCHVNSFNSVAQLTLAFCVLLHKLKTCIGGMGYVLSTTEEVLSERRWP